MSNPEKSNIELELTFLARNIPSEVQEVKPDHILDVYIPESLNIHSHLRLRQRAEIYEITKKVLLDEGDASKQIEYTIPLDANEFAALRPVSNKLIEKNRYLVAIEGSLAEVDIFMGALKGLVLIDFEFPTIKEKNSFTPPSCCLVEVTQQDFLAGGNLAGKLYSEIANDLALLNYRPIYIN